MLRLASVTSALLLVACVESGDEGMTVLNNTAVMGAECTLSGDPGQPFRSHGSIHWESQQGYLLTPLIQSRISSQGADPMETIDLLARTIQFTGANIELSVKALTVNGATSQADMALPAFRVLFSGSLPPDGSANVGFEAINRGQLEQIIRLGGNPSSQRIAAEVLASVTITGKTGSGGEVESAPFLYPISVCNDCVVIDNGACPMTVPTANVGNACNPYQDGRVDCCRNAQGALICPGTTGP